MANFRLCLLFCIAVAVAAPSNEEESREQKDESTTLAEDVFSVSTRWFQSCEAFVVCDGCNTQKYCTEWSFSIWNAYIQCPQVAPYCDSATAKCVVNAPANCSDPYA